MPRVVPMQLVALQIRVDMAKVTTHKNVHDVNGLVSMSFPSPINKMGDGLSIFAEKAGNPVRR